MNGFIIVDKPYGISSASVVAIVKGVTRLKAGHLGTLDPAATGVLPVALGKATKLFDLFAQKRKEYIADITFGATTDTLDGEGVFTITDGIIPEEKVVLKALQAFCGEIQQLPPQYSALSIGGVRAYKLARKGEFAPLKARTVNVDLFEVLSKVDEKTYRFAISCSSGTYIRALARDLGTACGTVAYMSALKRTRCGMFDITKASTLEQIRSNWQGCFLPIDYALETLPRYDAPSSRLTHLTNGLNVVLPNMPQGTFRLYCDDALIGLAMSVGQTVKITVNLYDANN